MRQGGWTAATRRLFLLGIGWALLSACPVSSALAACPNDAIREAQGTTYLPGCKALEMVSPVKKAVQPAVEPVISADGERIGFKSTAALGGTPGLQSPFGDLYVATRGASEWQTAATSPPAGLKFVNGGGYKAGPYTFTSDLSRWPLYGATQSQSVVGVSQFFQNGLDGALAPFSPPLVPIDDSGSNSLQFSVSESETYGTAADLSASVLRVNPFTLGYFAADPRDDGNGAPEDGGDRNSYVVFYGPGGEPSFELLARDKAGVVYGGRCGAHLGGGPLGTGAGAFLGRFNQGAISTDGDRIYFSTRPAQPPSVGDAGPPCSTANPLRIMKRLQTPTGPEITELIPGGPASGSDFYEGASEDGSKVFFASPRKLVAGDVDPSAEECSAELGKSVGCDLYLYDEALPPGSRIVQVSAGGTGDPDPGKGADVLNSVTAISTDGTHVYFVAQGVLTTDPNPEGATAQAGKPNLYLYERNAANPTGRTAFIGTLADGDQGQLWGRAGSLLGGAYAVPMEGPGGGDGHILAFASKAPLTADDTDAGHSDVYRYDADTEELERISKAAPGGSDNGAFDVLVNPNIIPPQANPAQQGRWASEDGEAIAFSTPEALVEGDDDDARNPYLWQGGALARIPGETEEAPTVSADGGEFAFSTTAVLLSRDIDTAEDVYVARESGGFPDPPPPPDPCAGEACQGSPNTSPGPPAVASQAATAGNICKKGFVKKRGKCVKKQSKKKKKRAKGHNRRSGK